MKRIPSRLAIPLLAVGTLCFLFLAIQYSGIATAYDDKPLSLRISAGPASTRRHEVAEYLCEQANKQMLSLRLLDNQGSEECLHQVQAGVLDAAVISSGVKIPKDDQVRVLAALQLEAVHVLVRPELANAPSLSLAMRNKRINVGVPGSTEWLLGRDFLSFAKVKLPESNMPGDVVLTEWSKQQIVDHCEALRIAPASERKGRLEAMPDCFLLLDTLPCSQVRHLTGSAGYVLKSLPATPAYLMDQLQDRRSPHTIIEREFLEATEIPAHSYFDTSAFPEVDCETVGVRLLLIANKEVPDEAITALMKTVFESEFTHRVRPKSPREIAVPYLAHDAAIGYLDRDKPAMLMQQAVEWLSNGLSFLGAFGAGALSLYGLIRRRKWRSASDYIAEIRAIGDALRKIDHSVPDEAHARTLSQSLEERLLLLEHSIIDDVCADRLKPDPSFFSILAMIKETQKELPFRRSGSQESPKRQTVRPARGNAAA
ncbi:MAG: hypothetical protein MUF23_06140 [Pirellula sp.]|nr:hypothetical protein [Pirellula sp.]